DLVLAVDDLNHQRQVFRQAQDLGGVQPAGMPVAEPAAQHRGAGKMHRARLEYYCLIEGAAVAVTVVFSDEYAQKLRLSRCLHIQDPPRRLRRAASTWPSHTATSHAATETTTFSPAVAQAPLCARRSVSRLKAEKVVK